MLEVPTGICLTNRVDIVLSYLHDLTEQPGREGKGIQVRELACHKRQKKQEKDRRRRSSVPEARTSEVNSNHFQSQEEDNKYAE